MIGVGNGSVTSRAVLWDFTGAHTLYQIRTAWYQDDNQFRMYYADDEYYVDIILNGLKYEENNLALHIAVFSGGEVYVTNGGTKPSQLLYVQPFYYDWDKLAFGTSTLMIDFSSAKGVFWIELGYPKPESGSKYTLAEAPDGQGYQVMCPTCRVTDAGDLYYTDYSTVAPSTYLFWASTNKTFTSYKGFAECENRWKSQVPTDLYLLQKETNGKDEFVGSAIFTGVDVSQVFYFVFLSVASSDTPVVLNYRGDALATCWGEIGVILATETSSFRFVATRYMKPSESIVQRIYTTAGDNTLVISCSACSTDVDGLYYSHDLTTSNTLGIQYYIPKAEGVFEFRSYVVQSRMFYLDNFNSTKHLSITGFFPVQFSEVYVIASGSDDGINYFHALYLIDLSSSDTQVNARQIVRDSLITNSHGFVQIKSSKVFRGVTALGIVSLSVVDSATVTSKQLLLESSASRESRTQFNLAYQLSYSYWLCNNASLKHYDLNATSTCTEAQQLIYSSANKWYMTPSVCQNDTSTSTLLGACSSAASNAASFYSKCEESYSQVCDYYFSSPPYSCTKKVYNTALTILSQAFSASSAIYGAFAIILVLMLKKYFRYQAFQRGDTRKEVRRYSQQSAYLEGPAYQSAKGVSVESVAVDV